MKISRTKPDKCPLCNQDVAIEEKGVKFLGIEVYIPWGKKIIKAK